MSGVSSEASLKDIVAIIEREAKNRQRNIFLSRAYTGLCYLALVLVIALSFIWGRELNVAILVVFFGGCGAAIGCTKKHVDALLQAAALQDPVVTPHLLDSLTALRPSDDQDKAFERECRRALERLLPAVSSSLKASFLPRHQAALVSLVKGLDRQLAEPCLKALIQVGSSSDAKELEDWAAKRGGGTPKEERLKALALQAAGDLRLRLAREIISHSPASSALHLEERDISIRG